MWAFARVCILTVPWTSCIILGKLQKLSSPFIFSLSNLPSYLHLYPYILPPILFEWRNCPCSGNRPISVGSLDPTPSWPLKDSVSAVRPFLPCFFNVLLEWISPMSLSPILQFLLASQSNAPSSYYPISSLSFMAKPFERLWRKPNTQSLCFLTSLLSNEALSLHHHCPETILDKVTNPSGHFWVFFLLGLSAAFWHHHFLFLETLLSLDWLLLLFLLFDLPCLSTPWACPRASPIHPVTQHAVGIQGTLIWLGRWFPLLFHAAASQPKGSLGGSVKKAIMVKVTHRLSTLLQLWLCGKRLRNEGEERHLRFQGRFPDRGRLGTNDWLGEGRQKQRKMSLGELTKEIKTEMQKNKRYADILWRE